MSEWRGLHNPERHRPNEHGLQMTRCIDCKATRFYPGCAPDDPCKCCLAAEVERLTAKLQAVRDQYTAALAARDRRTLDALAILDSMIRQEWGRYDGGIYFLTRVRNALRGDA